MKVTAIAGAIGGGLLGALIWGFVAHWTGYEIGYVAWAVGGLVGFGAFLLGGGGSTTGAACAVIALLGILGGKALAVNLQMSSGLAELHEKLLSDSRDYTASSRDERIAFMVSHGYTDAKSPRDVSNEEVEWFTTEMAPILEELRRDQTPYTTWSSTERGAAYYGSLRGNVSIWSAIASGFAPIDIIFALLGVSTAFKLGSVRREEEAGAPLGGSPEAGGDAAPSVP